VIDGVSSVVVGVLPQGVRNLAGIKSDVWPNWQPRQPTRRGPFGIVAIGRMKQGVSVGTVTAEMAAISERIFPLWEAGFRDRMAKLTPVPLREAIIGKDAPKTLWMFVAATALLLLTAIANVANLMLARMTARGRELSVRVVLGASRPRLARLVVAETMLVAATGAMLGIAVAWGLLKLLMQIAGSMPRLDTASIDATALGCGIGLAALTGLVIALHPILTLTRPDAAPSFLSGSREVGQGRRGSRLRGVLVGLEFALALPLLVGAALLSQSIAKLQRVDPGFDASNVAYTRLALPFAKYDTATVISAYWTRAIAAVAEVPGVTAVGYTTELPPAGVMNENNFRLADAPILPGGREPVSPWMIASSGYFDAIRARLIDGRLFIPSDTGPNNVMIVSESWAKHHTPNRRAVGQRVFEGGCDESCAPLYIVGVVSDVKYDGLSGNGEAAYIPATEGMDRGGYLVIRTRGDPGNASSAVQNSLRALDPSVPIDEIGAMSDRIYESTAQPLHWAMLLSGFALAAVSLAAIGIFGLLSYVVATMRREIGVRAALGAQRRQIARMIIGRGLAHCLIGAAVGLAIAIAGRRVLDALLFDMTAGDPRTLAVVTVALIGVAIAACWIPARTAARIEPMEALRAD
jgi:putative ABC transport system permease protein